MSASSFPLPSSTVPTSAGNNEIYAGPVSGGPATAAFRLAQLADVQAWLGTQTANRVFAGPSSGSPASPTFRTQVAEDIATGTPTAGFAAVSVGAATKPAWTFLNGTAIGFLTGKDRERPAPSTCNIYLATDSYITYASDGTKWYVTGIGPDKVAMGQITGGTGGFSDTTYMNSAASANAGPPMLATGGTFVFGFYCNALPGTGAKVLYSFGDGNITRGWLLRTSAANSNKFAALFKGINADANIEINQTVTTGPHIIAFNFNGTSIRSCLDGGTVVASAALTGTYVPPTSVSAVNLGKYFGAAGLAADWMDFIFYAGYTSALSDGELQTASSSFASLRLGNTTADPAYMHMAENMGTQGGAAGVSIWQAFGTAATRPSYLSGQGTGFSKAFY